MGNGFGERRGRGGGRGRGGRGGRGGSREHRNFDTNGKCNILLIVCKHSLLYIPLIDGILVYIITNATLDITQELGIWQFSRKRACFSSCL